MKITGISFDVSQLPPKKEDWFDQLTNIILDSLKHDSEIIVFPELMHLALGYYSPKKELKEQMIFASEAIWREYIPKLLKVLKGKKHFIVLGSGPYHEKMRNKDIFFNRAPIIKNGLIETFDKIYLTPWETQFTSGKQVKMFEYNGLNIVPLICFDIEHPKISIELKQKGVDLILVPSATSNKNGSERVLRCASARSVELGAAVFVVPVIGSISFNDLIDHNEGRQGLFLPAQESIKHNQIQYSDYRTKVTDAQSYRIEVDQIKKVKEQNEETKPFLSQDPILNFEIIN